jgi:hypothetical protein
MTRFAIVSSTDCARFILCRRQEFEAFDGIETSLGLFKTEDAAVAAISQKNSALL